MRARPVRPVQRIRYRARVTPGRAWFARWTQRALATLESRRLGPLWLGLALFAGIAVLYALWSAMFGLVLPGLDSDEGRVARIRVVIALLTAFLVVTERWDRRCSARDLARLRPLSGCSQSEFASILGELDRFGRRQRLVVGLVGVALGVAVIAATSADPGALLAASAWSADLVWAILANVVLFALMARGFYTGIAARRALDRMARSLARIDLLDRAALHPFARQGLRRAFYWAGGSSIASLLALDLPRLWPLFAILAATVALATLALLEPARVIRGRLGEEKRVELGRVRSRIEGAKGAALGRGGARAGGEAALLPGLLAYEARIESVSEWPFDTPTLLRFAALLVVAIGSWLGGAVVERLLGSVLD